MREALASNTKKTYSSGMKQFLIFCQQTGIVPKYPLDEDTLIHFSVFLARSVQHGTIKNYLSAVKHYHSNNGHALMLKNFLRLQLVLRGIKRVQGSNKRVRRPITLAILNLFYCLLNIEHTRNKDYIMLWAAMTLAFFGFLRIGEITCNSVFNQKYHLTETDVSLLPKNAPQYMLIRIKSSKTDPFRQGQTIVIGRSHSHVCPISAMKAHLAVKEPSLDLGPLFKYTNGSPLTRDKLTREIRTLLPMGGLNSSEFAGHSFRIGAATTAAAAHLPPWLIKVLGRWSSDCFEKYIRTPVPLLAQVSQKLCSK